MQEAGLPFVAHMLALGKTVRLQVQLMVLATVITRFARSGDGQELWEAELPARRKFIPGIIEEGLTILSGPPKAGKSRLLIQIGLAPAGGLDQHMPAAICWAASSFIWGRTGPPGVDFLLKKMVEHKPTPWLKFVYDVPHIDAGLVDHLRRYKDANPDLGVVGIDTLAHIRDEPKSRNEQWYQ